MQHLEQEFSNAIGYVMDTAVDPPKRLGMAFLVSKSRAVTCASEVFHYVEAPWALKIKFPFPDASLAVKTVHLHNDFDKVEARAQYLKQTGSPAETMSSFMNDLAMLVIDHNPPASMSQDRIAELNRALSLPFSSEGVEASGNLRGAEFVQIVNTIVESGREGLLTLYDSRNIPVANLLMARGGILKVFYKQVMSSEMAFCELVYRQPAVGFAFRPGANIAWGDVPDVQTPPDHLCYEAMRRAQEIPNLYQQLGGKDARYQQVVQQFDPSAASEEIQWMVEPLWQSLDGYLTLDKTPLKIGVDTYTVLIAIRELVNRGVISQINRLTPFPCTGVIGDPLISHTDFEVHPWDPLQAFYLDPASGKPTWLEGNFFGVANSLQPKNMLHTIDIPNDVNGALILKDYKLIGIHSGPQVLKPGQPAPPVKCFQFMWMGALLDLSTRKSRPGGAGEEAEGVGTLRTMDANTEEEEPPEGERIQCPNCFAVNAEYGECKTCGTMIEAPPPEEEPSNPILASKPVKQLRQIQKKHKITNQQAMIIGAAVLCLPMCLLALCGPKPKVEDKPIENTKIVKAPTSDKKAVETAVEYAGFSATAPPLYWYADTSEQTEGAKSFGLYSETSNQKILCIVQNDTTPLTNLDQFAGKPPYTDVDRADIQSCVVDGGDQILGAGKLKWVLGRYTAPKHKEPVTVLIASFPAVQTGKSILVIGQSYQDSDERKYDYKTTLFVLDQQASETTAKGNEERLEKGEPGEVVVGADEDEEDLDEEGKKVIKVSTEEDIDKFLEAAKAKLQEKLDLPEKVTTSAAKYEEENKEPKKWKGVSLLIGIDREGQVRRMEKNLEDPKYEIISKALEKAVQDVSKFDDPPVVKTPEFQFKVRLLGTKIDLAKN